MTFKTKHQVKHHEATFGKILKHGIKLEENKLWKCCQFQAWAPIFKQTKDVKVREFGNQYEMEKFMKNNKDKYPYQKGELELAEFIGLPCYKPSGVYMLYYSKKPLILKPSFAMFTKSSHYSRTPICLPRGKFPKDLPIKERFFGAI